MTPKTLNDYLLHKKVLISKLCKTSDMPARRSIIDSIQEVDHEIKKLK